MLESSAKDKQEIVSLKSLSELTGFPVKMIKEELFSDKDFSEETVSLDDLRVAMMSYLDQTMLQDQIEE